MNFVVWISGATAVGKSTLAKLLERAGFAIVAEDISPKEFAQFISDPQRHCAELQESIMNSRLDQWSSRRDSSHIAFDRSVDEDFNVFCQLHRQLGFLTESQLVHLRSVASRISAELPPPDLIVHMHLEMDALRRRNAVDGQPPFIRDNLERLQSLYGSWVASRPEDVVSINNERCRVETLERIFGAARHVR